MRKLFLLFGVTIFTSCMFAQKGKPKAGAADKEFLSKQPDGIYAKIETHKGNIYLFLESKKTPMTVANFVALSDGSMPNKAKAAGVPFYDGLKFHRVIPNFMVQGGDPLGNGMGDPGYKFPDEFDTTLKHVGPGILSMANSGPGTNGSQFFITHVATPWLNGKHTIFGHVVQGQDVVNAIVGNDTIVRVAILRKGKEAEGFVAATVFENEKKGLVERAAAKEKAALAEVEKTFANATVTASGLKYIVMKDGAGASPTAASTVTVHYTGTFLDGRVFDSSVSRGQPATFPLSNVIKGWTEGLQLMKEGAKYKFFIPSNLAYGEQGYGGGIIPPNTPLIFEIELIKANQ